MGGLTLEGIEIEQMSTSPACKFCDVSASGIKRTGESGSKHTTTYDPIYLRRSIAMYIIQGELPFKHVESEQFKKLIADFEPRFTVPCRTSITQDVLQIYKEERENLKSNLVSDDQGVQ